MGDRNPIRDRTLILRILVPGLEAGLRDKMEARAALANKGNDGTNTSAGSAPKSSSGGASSGSGDNVKEQILDLEGVRVQPTNEEDYTVWKFHCDGAEYPARLVNLPCPVELHKTHDHAMYYKCTDVAQMLIVYEDKSTLEEDKNSNFSYSGGIDGEYDMMATAGVGGSNNASSGVTGSDKNGFPSYYPHGLTPPLQRVVERRFMVREYSPIAPPRTQVTHVENELIELMQKISKEGGGGSSNASAVGNKKNKVPSLAAAQQANKVLEEIDEQVVDYEPWMDDNGKQPHGIEFDADDQLCFQHPEVWLDTDEIKTIRKEVMKKIEEEEKIEQQKKEEKLAKGAKKKSKKPNKKNQNKKNSNSNNDTADIVSGGNDDDIEPSASTFGSSTKKGIASKKNTEHIDEVTQAALMLTSEDLLGDDAFEDDLFDLDEEEGFLDLSDLM